MTSQAAASGTGRPRHHPDTASRVFDGEAVIITPAENMVRMLDEVGSRIWELADGTRTVADIAEVLGIEFDVSTEQALAEAAGFIDALVSRKLMTW